MEDGDSNQEHPQPLTTNHDASSPKKPSTSSIVVDRLKRDEWSEGAVSSLLEAYETKWVLRNRAKLKGQDWEDVAKHVSSRASHTKSPKTQTQCKNKIESMKKRYRSESATADGSSWPLYSRLDHLLRGNASTSVQPQPQAVLPLNCSAPLLLLEPPSLAVTHPPQQPPAAQMSHGSNGVGTIKVTKPILLCFPEEGFKDDHKPERATEMDTDSSTPVLCREKAKVRPKKVRRRYKEEKEEIAGSIRWLAEVVMRTERARMETMKEIEKMRAEAEVKRGEMDLKRTEIMANTQIEIARLFAASVQKGGVDSSLRIGRN
ncbi:PREDICTED: trihelix transcription factor ASIL1 isoform X1 [Brassica oleracea var. oleracea]|uniref:trihelix transcription factor ASIL1 isoform X1 n=1 Tax=Brassica oleracea var. oleracea TaxID=109376 RepID=UPI0006A6B71F|nr:PREDICTED: trihelix transcription factor ASIL1 isoform X1 [Brassica oleracea var. oleracea]